MQLQLTADELELLDEVLSTELGSLKEQVYKSDLSEMKDRLRAREAVLVGLLERLRSARSSPSV